MYGTTLEDLDAYVESLPARRGKWEMAYNLHEIIGMLRLMRYVDGQERRAFTRHLLAIASRMPYMNGRFAITERGVALQPFDGEMIALR